MKLNYQLQHLHNLANLTTVKLPNLADNNATLSKLGNFSKTGVTQNWSIQFGNAATDSSTSFTLSNLDSFSNPNFAKFSNDTLAFKSSEASATSMGQTSCLRKLGEDFKVRKNSAEFIKY